MEGPIHGDPESKKSEAQSDNSSLFNKKTYIRHRNCDKLLKARLIINRKNDVPMIFIKETNLKENISTIEVDGMLDDESIPVLKRVCEHHLASGKSVEIDLGGIIHITREGRRYLQKIQGEVSIAHLPDFVKVDNT
jgi:hypothetical protein